MATEIVLSREDLLKYFAEAFNAARKEISSPGTRDLAVEEWEVWFLQVEKKIFSDITDGIDTVQKLKDYFRKLSIIWANEAFEHSWQEVLDS